MIDPVDIPDNGALCLCGWGNDNVALKAVAVNGDKSAAKLELARREML